MKANDEIWILLNRHIVNKSRKEEHISLRVQQEEMKGNNVLSTQYIMPKVILFHGSYEWNTLVKFSPQRRDHIRIALIF